MDISFNSEGERARKRRRSNETTGEKEINIQVVVRCRGRIEREIAANSPTIITTHQRDVRVRQSSQSSTEKLYTFDRVYGPDADQARIFDSIVIPILNEVKAGYNCTLFAYGQTSTGKTYTMEGILDTLDGVISYHAGIIPRTLFNLFKDLEAEAQDFSVKVSYIELYNEDLKDLLSEDQRKLRIQDEGIKKGILIGHEEVLVKNAADGIRILKQGSAKRHAAQTNYNRNSSRSHSVFSITVHIKETMPDGEDLLKVGKFNLVDLAGSECIGRSGAESNRAKEAGNINKSLLTLGRCINSLNERSVHIPFRESKLTRLLQDSLGGKTKTCIIATISPARLSYDETISTLDYALRAKNIRNKPVANQRVTKKALIKEYISEIERLKMDLLAAREKTGFYISHEGHKLLVEENRIHKDANEQLRKDNERLEVENKIQKDTNEKLRKDNERLIVENKYQQAANEQLRKDNETLATENKIQKAANEQLRKDNETLATESKIQKDTNEQLRRDNEGLILENKIHKDVNERLQGEISKLKRDYEKLQEKNKNLTEHIDSQNKAIASCQNITAEGLKKEICNLKEQDESLTRIIENENSKVMLMKEELLTNISTYLSNFTNAQTDSLKKAFETVHDSIQTSVNAIGLCREANITTLEGMKTSNMKHLDDLG